jgi:Bacterial protein of unknown function (Gcw_chp)
MKRVAYTLLVAATLASTSAFAADMAVKAPPAPPAPPPSPWDIAITAGLMNDYNFRGISQSAHKPSVQGGFEPRYNFTKDLQGYVGISGESIDFPNRAAAEIDLYGGIRPTFDKLALDFGFWYYYYPGGQCFNVTPFCGGDGAFPGGPTPLPNGNVAKKDASFYEWYAKATYTVNDNLALGIQEWYSPSVVNTGADGWYTVGNLTLTAPTSWFSNGVGAYVSGDLGYWALGTSDSFYGVVSPLGNYAAGVPYKSYWNWDAGLGFTWKAFTLDLRYYDTNLSKADCNVFTSDQTASFVGQVTPTNPTGFGSNWCGAAFIAKLSFATNLSNLK